MFYTQAEYWLSSPYCQTEHSRRAIGVATNSLQAIPSAPVFIDVMQGVLNIVLLVRFKPHRSDAFHESRIIDLRLFARCNFKILCGVNMRARGAFTLHHAKAYPNSNFGNSPFSKTK
jgi:hypothetical protein